VTATSGWSSPLDVEQIAMHVGELLRLTGMSRPTLYRRLAEHAKAGRAVQVSRGRHHRGAATVSDRLTVRLISRLARASARKRASLAELRALDDGSVLQDQWIAEMAVRWAAHRAAASQTGSDGAAWLDGRSARAVSCDATVIPVVTGQVEPAALDDLVSLCLQFAGHGPHCVGHGPHCGPPPTDPPVQPAAADQPADPPADSLHPARPRPPTPQALEMLRHAIIGKAVDLVSGPGGLASFLRTGQLGARLAGPSLPLDVGRSAEIPAAIRRAVILRDQHCRWAGGYFL
jgi:hypothetical protein